MKTEDSSLNRDAEGLPSTTPDWMDDQFMQDIAEDQVKNEEIEALFDYLSPPPQQHLDLLQWSEDHPPLEIYYTGARRIDVSHLIRGYEQALEQTFGRPEEVSGDEVTYITSRSTGYRNQMVDSSQTPDHQGRRSGRHIIAARVPFPNKKPIWAMLATDFTSVPAIPRDITLWCPCCATMTLEKDKFRMSPLSIVPGETCMDCRKERTTPPAGFLVCWSSSMEYKGCGRLLPKDRFLATLSHENFTGVFCHDCRAFGHGRARLEGRYTEG
ncbi:hypothetical protein M426DRAFT_14154 [Hypoxylon sp. CI-4A]|nr:hypothetical protein M426DRAFT_14154 [Hypoxylon sp. CI-4A]